MTAYHANLDSLRYYLMATDAEREQELTDGGYMEDIFGEEIADMDSAIDYWMGEDATALPAWAHLTVVGIEHDVEMVHVTSAERAAEIIMGGFKGITKMSQVATSTAFFGRTAYDGAGFCFGYTTDDVASGKAKEIGYFGEIALIFRATALRVESSFDGDEQMIFVGCDAHSIQAMTVSQALDSIRATVAA
ncbi:MAG: hypothetical protein JNJ94_12180 [Chlorobi bacterium]|nr:hypothetical protein [Chlorobiota bacterium]